MLDNDYNPKSYNVICQRCGFKYKAEQVREEWTGLLVCHGPRTNDCWEPRNRQDFQRPHRPTKPLPWKRPEATDSFVTVQRQSLLIGVQGSGEVGSFGTPGVSVALSGNSATGAVGTFTIPFQFNAATAPVQNWWWGAAWDSEAGNFVIDGGNNDVGSVKHKWIYSTNKGATWAVTTGSNVTSVAHSNVTFNTDATAFAPLIAVKDGGQTVFRSNDGGVNALTTFTLNMGWPRFSRAQWGPRTIWAKSVGTANADFYDWNHATGTATTHTSKMPSSSSWGAMASNGTIAVCLAGCGGTASNKGAYSTDPLGGAAWTAITVPSGEWQWMVWNGTYFFATGAQPGEACRSLDGITWESASIPATFTRASITYDVENYGQLAAFTGSGYMGMPIGRFTAQGGGSPTETDIFITSKDNGDTWQEWELPSAAYWQACAASDDNFVVGAYTADTTGSTKLAYSSGTL